MTVQDVSICISGSNKKTNFRLWNVFCSAAYSCTRILSRLYTMDYFQWSVSKDYALQFFIIRLFFLQMFIFSKLCSYLDLLTSQIILIIVKAIWFWQSSSSNYWIFQLYWEIRCIDLGFTWSINFSKHQWHV